MDRKPGGSRRHQGAPQTSHCDRQQDQNQIRTQGRVGGIRFLARMAAGGGRIAAAAAGLNAVRPAGFSMTSVSVTVSPPGITVPIVSSRLLIKQLPEGSPCFM